MADLANLAVRVTSTGIEVTHRELQKLGQSAAAAERQTDNLGKTTTATSGVFSRFAGILSAAGIGLAARQLADYTDTMAKMKGQLGLVTSSHEELNSVYQRALALANETGQSLETTVQLYAKLSRATQDLGLSQDQLFTVTKAINQAFVVSGATAQESSAAMLQLSQGMASGVLRGEELNSVMENGPRLARALADGLGVSIGELRRMGAEGELTAQKVAGALLKMSGSISSEFDQMPMTVGRAIQEIQNNLLDLFGKTDAKPLIKSLQDFGATIKDPSVIEGLGRLAAGFMDVLNVAAKAAAVLPGLTKFLAEGLAAAVGGPAADDMDRMATRIQTLTNQLNLFKQAGAENDPQARKLAEELKKLNAVYDLQLGLINSTSKAHAAGAAATGAASKATSDYKTTLDAANKLLNSTSTGTNKLTDAQKKLLREQEAARKALAQQKAGLQDYIGDLEFEVKISKESAREQEILTAQRKYGTVATSESEEAIRRLVGTLYDQQEAARAAKEEQDRMARAVEDAAQASAKAAEDAMKPWNDALQDMASNVDSTFVQGWNDALGGASDGFDNFVSNTWDSFKNLMANMLHLAITRPIVMQISAAMGGMVPGGAAMAGVAPGGVTPSSIASGGLSSLATGITAAGKGLYSALGTLTNDLGLFKVSNAFNAKALSTSGLSMAADFGGGLVGKFAGDKVFGETSGIGATVGGIAGSALIPIPGLGAAIGSFIGTGLEKAAQKLFGQKNDGNNRGMADFDLAAGTVSARGVGKSYAQESVDAAQSLAEQVKAFSDSIGGSNLKANITVSGKEGILYGGKSFGKDSESFFQQAFKDVVEASDKVNERLKPLIIGFNGTAEEIAAFATGLITLDTNVGGISDSMLALIQNAKGTAAEIVQFSQAVVSISQQAGINTVTNAIKEFTTVAPTAATAYRDHTAVLMEQIANFDGSAESASKLNNLLIENKTAAYEFAMAIQTIGQQFGMLAADQAEYIRQSVLTADQLREARTKERDALRETLGTLTDPQEADKAAKSILELNRQIFDSLDQSAKVSRAEEFAGIAESTNATLQGLVQGTLTGLQTTQEDINTRTMAMLDSAADKYQQAADTQLTAAGKLDAAINTLVNNGITVQIVNANGTEVVA